MASRRASVLFGLVLVAFPSSAAAAPDLGSLRGKASGKASGVAKGDKALSKRTDRPWIQRWAPERNMVELGVFAGAFFPPRDLELFRPTLLRPRQGFQPFRKVAPDVGARLGYFPIRHFGIEVEGAYVPTQTLAHDLPANIFAVRGHLMAQLGLYSVVPFVLVGGGALGVSSASYVVRNDVDPALHLGLGVKIFVNRRIALRLDLRDTISPPQGFDRLDFTNSFEVLAGLTITLGRQKDRDVAPAEPAPAPPPDRDGDGFIDPQDKCPDDPGVAPDGCPARTDRDGDGFFDDEDQCPDEPGIAPDGCPDPDPDRDGILAPDDQCPTEPETVNGFEDADGCPDDVPDDVRSFEGTLAGVNFDTGKATLKRGSQATLDRAVEIMTKYPNMRVEISGHTDNSGSRDFNMDLSQRRADTVKQYLSDKGIDPSRIQTRGAGPDEPVDTNANKAGKAKNRRIEFHVLQ